MTSDTIPFSTMKEQVGKKNVIYAPSKWVYPTTIQTEDEFQTSDEIHIWNLTECNLICDYQETGAEEGCIQEIQKRRITAKSISLSESWEKPYNKDVG